MGLFRKGQSSSSSEPENSGPSEKLQGKRRSLEADDLLRELYSKSNLDWDASPRGAEEKRRKNKEIFEEIERIAQVMAKQSSKLNFSNLRPFASPCFLQNIITDDFIYTFQMEDPQGGNSVQYKENRMWVDRTPQPMATAELIVKAMRIVCLRKLSFNVEDVIPVLVQSAPYEVDIERVSQGNYRMTLAQTNVASSIGYFDDMSDLLGVAKNLKNQLDAAQSELLAKQKLTLLDDDEKKEPSVAQLTKKKPPQCPEHRNFLEPSGIEGELHCPIGGCETKARKKSGSKADFVHEPPKVEIEKPPIDLDLHPKEREWLNAPIDLRRYPSASPDSVVVAKEKNGRVYLVQLDLLSMRPKNAIDVTHLLGRPTVRHRINSTPINVTSMASSKPTFIPGPPPEQYLEMELRVKLAE